MFTKKLALVLCVGAVVLLANMASADLIPMTVVGGDPNAAARNSLAVLTDQNFNTGVYSGDSDEGDFWFVMTPTAGGTFQVDHILANAWVDYTGPIPLQVTVGNTLGGPKNQIIDGTTVQFITGNTGVTVTWNAVGTGIDIGNYKYMEIGYTVPGGAVSNQGAAGKTGGFNEAEVFGVTPEPATMCLLAIGGIGALLKRRRNA